MVGALGTLICVPNSVEMSRVDLAQQLEQLHLAAFGWALSCCEGNRAAAEDALQATYLKILEGRARFEGRSSLRTWVFGVLRRTASEEDRRGGSRRWRPLSLVESHPATGSDRHHPDAGVLRSEESSHLLAALEALPARQRDVLHLVFYQELTIAEAAEVLSVGLGTARTHYERGKAALRRKLEGMR
ncbi:MAG: RNA polymerase sigma factor [Gemmatimonadota bacterium]